ncbi:MAG: hypothetical protein IKG46_06505 [Solobacterium sp.]|nr:hypothetical protein [Solobacterium sp.]
MASLTGMLKYKGEWNSLAEFKEAVLSETELIDETPDQLILRIRVGFVSLSFVQREDGTVTVEELRREHYDEIKKRYHL